MHMGGCTVRHVIVQPKKRISILDVRFVMNRLEHVSVSNGTLPIITPAWMPQCQNDINKL